MPNETGLQHSWKFWTHRAVVRQLKIGRRHGPQKKYNSCSIAQNLCFWFSWNHWVTLSTFILLFSFVLIVLSLILKHFFTPRQLVGVLMWKIKHYFALVLLPWRCRKQMIFLLMVSCITWCLEGSSMPQRKVNTLPHVAFSINWRNSHIAI